MVYKRITVADCGKPQTALIYFSGSQNQDLASLKAVEESLTVQRENEILKVLPVAQAFLKSINQKNKSSQAEQALYIRLFAKLNPLVLQGGGIIF